MLIGILSPPPVDAEPRSVVDPWCPVNIGDHQHIVGITRQNKVRVTTPVMQMGPERTWARTYSGRFYSLGRQVSLSPVMRAGLFVLLHSWRLEGVSLTEAEIDDIVEMASRKAS